MARRRSPDRQGLRVAHECIAYSNETRLHVSEEGIGATFTNIRRKELRKIRYDDCYYRGAQKQADYIIGSDQSIDVILELKGSNLARAVSQVADTLQRWRLDENRYPQIVCLIVFGHTFPRMRSNLGVLEREFLNENGTLLWIRQTGLEKFGFRKLAGARR